MRCGAVRWAVYSHRQGPPISLIPRGTRILFCTPLGIHHTCKNGQYWVRLFAGPCRRLTIYPGSASSARCGWDQVGLGSGCLAGAGYLEAESWYTCVTDQYIHIYILYTWYIISLFTYVHLGVRLVSRQVQRGFPRRRRGIGRKHRRTLCSFSGAP